MRSFRSPLYGLKNPFDKKGEPPAFNVSFTGLSSDSIGAYGQIGNHAAISYTITPDLTTETVKWSNSANPADAATFGTGANPTTFASVDGFRVYLHVTDDPVDNPDVGPVTRSFSFPVRYAPGAFGALVAQEFGELDGEQTYVFAAATGANLTWTYTLVSPPTGVTIDSASRTVTFDLDNMMPQVSSFTVRATDQYGRTIDQSASLTVNFVVKSIVLVSAGPIDINGDIPISYTINKDDPTVEAVVYYDDLPVPSASEFAGANPSYADQGTVSLFASGGPINLDLIGDFDGSVRLALLPTGGGNLDVAISPTFTLGGTPSTPAEWSFSGTSILSSPTVNPPTISGTQITG